jgi:hypothetical protein
MKKLFAAVMSVSGLLAGCASLVEPGQTREEMDASGATRWVLTEYDFEGSHFVWIPHWSEALLHVSTPHASNCKKLDVLEFKDGKLVGVQQLGRDRDRWAEVLRAHGRIVPPTGDGEAPPLHLAVTEKILHEGATTECVFFAAGFPKYGARSNPACHRLPSEIRGEDVLYYLKTSGGEAQEVVIRDGKVAEIRPAERLSKDWQAFFHPTSTSR